MVASFAWSYLHSDPVRFDLLTYLTSPYLLYIYLTNVFYGPRETISVDKRICGGGD